MRTPATATLLSVAAVALSILPSTAAVPSTASGSSTEPRAARSELVPVAGDAHVKASRRSTNFGSSARLVVDGRKATRSQALLRVKVPDAAAGRTFKLVLRPSTSSARGVRVYGTRKGWDEGRVTWDKRPRGNRTLVGTSNALKSGVKEVIRLDASQVTPGKVLSLRLKTSARKKLVFAAAEGPAGMRPRLRITAGESTTTTTTPTPAPVRTMFGACPTVGTSSSSVITKYGNGASIRVFVPGGFNTVDRPAGASKLHVSWKPTLGSAITDTALVSAFSNLQDGDLVEVWHESDVKYRKGDDLGAMLAMKNQFHDRVVALRQAGRIPQVRTVNTWAGWSVDSTSNIDPSNLHARADILGIDMDGIPEADNFYPYAARQMGAKFVEAYKEGGYTGWTVPEFSMPSVDSDPTSTKRVAWFQAEAAAISQGLPTAGIPAPQMIAWFDTAGIIGETEMLSSTNEINAWKTLVADNL
jgi:hypothetical protein